MPTYPSCSKCKTIRSILAEKTKHQQISDQFIFFSTCCFALLKSIAMSCSNIVYYSVPNTPKCNTTDKMEYIKQVMVSIRQHVAVICTIINNYRKGAPSIYYALFKLWKFQIPNLLFNVKVLQKKSKWAIRNRNPHQYFVILDDDNYNVVVEYKL